MIVGTMYSIITKVVLQPMFLLLLLVGAAIVNLWFRRRETRGRLLLLTIPYVVLVLACMPAVVFPLLGTLEWQVPPLSARPTDADAIVVLGGGAWGADATRPRPVLTSDSLYRCLRASEVYHEGRPCPVIVTGANSDPRPSEPSVAATMRDTLVGLGVPEADVIVEPRARTTYENAVESAKILRERGLRRVVLVTDATHMPRSLLCFRKQGFDPVPAACSHRAVEFRLGLGSFLPSPGAMGDLMAVVHEWIGLAWYRARDRI
jgi:uncharacterized SAM-binding protein YcdF (DUF218 family)